MFDAAKGKRTYFSGKVFEDGSAVDGSCSTNATVRGGSTFQVSVDTTHGELGNQKMVQLTNVTEAEEQKNHLPEDQHEPIGRRLWPSPYQNLYLPCHRPENKKDRVRILIRRI